MATTLTPTQRYAAGALLALALRQAQIHQSVLLGAHDDDDEEQGRTSTSSGGGSSSSSSGGGADADLWTHDSHGLLRPVFRFLEIDPKAWSGLEETAASTEAKHHIGAFLRIIFEEDGESSSDRSVQELALAKGVDVMVMSLGNDSEVGSTIKGGDQDALPSSSGTDKSPGESSHDDLLGINKLTLDDIPANNHRKMALLFALLSACVADKPVSQEEEDRKSSRFRKGYDARHRVALRLLSTWLDVKWIKMEAIEVMVACSAMAAAKEQEQSQESASPKSKWEKWKRGGIIGAAALTGGALLAITGGLAAPAIAAGFGALAPTLGTLVPVIGASGFAAMATAAGSVAGSVAVAASFGAAGAGLTGSKMARRIGSVKEFEFKPIGESHNQGRLAVGILISGFAFDEDDFCRPWEGWKDNLERTCHGIDEARCNENHQIRQEKCLLKCFSRDCKEIEGLVERVVLLGAPVSVKGERWEAARKMVAGRFVNVYSTDDWILGVTFRASLLTQGLAGIQAIDVPGVENVDVTELVDGHSSYLSAAQQILEHLELNTYYPVFVPLSAVSEETDVTVT
uniref:Uncharacterized protein n=1 Tax=Oryza punctata TaxID=4537 RepID=A0A0E0K7T0_ORYPU